MTGIERLRELADAEMANGYAGVSRILSDIADQIDREQDEHARCQLDVYLRVRAVERDMEHHVLGHEGMDDSPVARWARELREALSGHEDAYEWVEAHGGLDAVKEEWRSRVPYDRHEKTRQRLLDHIAECETALGRRNRRIEELGHRVNDLMTENAELRRRAMPEGMEWPKYDTGEMVDFGDEVDIGDGVGASVDKVSFYGDQWRLYDRYGCEINEDMMGPGERVKRPEPKVLDADGAEIREKCDVWWICEGDERGVHAERLRVETIGPNGLIECSPYNGGTWVYLEPSELYVNKPVPASDGKPLREGETVWLNERGFKSKLVDRGEPLKVVAFDKNGSVGVLDRDGIALRETSPWWFNPSCLTHERPESKCRDCQYWQKDPTANNMGVCWFYYHEREGQDCYAARRADIGACEEFMPRARALAERDA